MIETKFQNKNKNDKILKFHNANARCWLQWPSSQSLGLRAMDCWDFGFVGLGVGTHRRNCSISLVSVVVCQVEVSRLGWSLVQRSPTECGWPIIASVKLLREGLERQSGRKARGRKYAPYICLKHYQHSAYLLSGTYIWVRVHGAT